MGLLAVQVIYDNAPWSWVIWPLIVALLSTIFIVRLFLTPLARAWAICGGLLGASVALAARGAEPLSVSAALAMAVQCAPGIDPNMLVGIALHESGLVTDVVHHNTNGTTDFGLMQINSANFDLLGINASTALDPCRSMRAAADLMRIMSRYNTGTADRGIANGYVAAVSASVRAVRGNPATAEPPPVPPAASIFVHPAAGRELVLNQTH
jgi:type IV secretion system protein VirB1